jgi:hypothetical protein
VPKQKYLIEFNEIAESVSPIQVIDDTELTIVPELLEELPGKIDEQFRKKLNPLIEE